jgi:hypothetical protein
VRKVQSQNPNFIVYDTALFKRQNYTTEKRPVVCRLGMRIKIKEAIVAI